MRLQRFCPRQTLQKCKQRIPETLRVQKELRLLERSGKRKVTLPALAVPGRKPLVARSPEALL